MGFIDSVSTREDVTQINIYSMPAQTCFFSSIFERLAAEKIFVDMICRPLTHCSSTRVSFTINDSDLPKSVKILTDLKRDCSDLKFSICASNCKISVYGKNMCTEAGAAAAVFSALCEAGADILLISTGDNEISILVPKSHLHSAEHALKNLI